jgi:beta-glucosidase
MVLSADIGEAAMRESDLLAFELALDDGHPGAVMCAYNRVNGVPACQNAHLLNDILKTAWGFPGWVMSDWGAIHSLEAASDGVDQESAAEGGRFDSVPPARLVDMNRRIVRSMLAVGLFDHPPERSPIDYGNSPHRNYRWPCRYGRPLRGRVGTGNSGRPDVGDSTVRPEWTSVLPSLGAARGD